MLGIEDSGQREQKSRLWVLPARVAGVGVGGGAEALAGERGAATFRQEKCLRRSRAAGDSRQKQKSERSLQGVSSPSSELVADQQKAHISMG